MERHILNVSVASVLGGVTYVRKNGKDVSVELVSGVR